MRTMFVVGFLLLVGIPAVAQETRSTISGTVRDEQGVIPGASVKVTNVGTGVTQTLTTNTSGYFEARLLNAGTYDVFVEMTGFRRFAAPRHAVLRPTLALPLTLEIGAIAEEITVTGEAPLLEVTTLRQGLVLDEKKIGELPVQSNMPVLFARFAPGMMARGVIPFAGQGFIQHRSISAYAFASTIAEWDWPSGVCRPAGRHLRIESPSPCSSVSRRCASRSRPDYLAIVTIAGGRDHPVLGRLDPIQLADRRQRRQARLDGVLPGPQPHGLENDDRFRLGAQPFDGYRLFMMVLGWSLVAVIGLLTWALMRSPWGRVLKSIARTKTPPAPSARTSYRWSPEPDPRRVDRINRRPDVCRSSAGGDAGPVRHHADVSPSRSSSSAVSAGSSGRSSVP